MHQRGSGIQMVRYDPLSSCDPKPVQIVRILKAKMSKNINFGRAGLQMATNEWTKCLVFRCFYFRMSHENIRNRTETSPNFG